MFEKEIQAFESWQNEDYAEESDEVRFGDLYERSGQLG